MKQENGELSCGIDYHADTTGNFSADFGASGTFSAHLQTKHAVDTIHHHDQKTVSN